MSKQKNTACCEKFKTSIGGQALIEGIMIIMMLGFPLTTEMNAWGWIFTVVLTSVLFFSIVLSTKGLLLKKADISVLKKIGYYTIISCLIFFLSWQTTIGLNYALDFSEPTVYSTRIAEKEYHSASKGSSASYSFTTYIDGKQKEIEVTSDIYKKYEIGYRRIFKRFLHFKTMAFCSTKCFFPCCSILKYKLTLLNTK